MHYYIDGYNLMFRLGRDENTLTTQRQQLISELNIKLKLLEVEATVVFDSQYQLGESSRSHFQHLEILFSAYGETADNCILEEIKSENNPHHTVVVTSDKKLAWFARRCSAKTESVEQFMDWLNKRYKNKLRQQKEGVKAPKTLLVKEKISQPHSPPKEPKASASAEECYDYYLAEFQKRFEELPVSREVTNAKTEKSAKKKGTEKKGIKKNSVSKKDSGHVDDMTRWLRAFSGEC